MSGDMNINMSQFTAKQAKLWKEIQRILWEKWDPIGVYEEDGEWDDEYDCYVPHIFSMAIEGKDHVSIAAYLTSTIKQNMGLSRGHGESHDLKIAKLIVQTKEEAVG